MSTTTKSGAGRFVRSLGLMVLGGALLVSTARAANEAALMEIWKKHMATPDDHEVIIKACTGFTLANRTDPLLPVVQEIEAWHRLRTGNTSEAVRLLESCLADQPGPTNEAARRLALAWLSRLDREKVMEALKMYYRQEIAFPKTLEALRGHPKVKSLPPFKDRFGRPWKYELTGFSKLSGLPNQKYLLQSTELGGGSDLKSQLQAPYGSQIDLVPVEVSTMGSQSAVKFKRGDNTGAAILLGVGNVNDGIYLAYVGTQVVLVCDYTHWKLFPKP